MKLIILDRDGVINHDSEHYIKSPEEWQPIEGSMQAIGRLSQAGWRVVLATNQSGVGRGLFSAETLCAIHARMHASVAAAGGQIDAIFFCPHLPDSGCGCRKPAPGMLQDIARRFEIKLQGVPMVGDSLRDLQAAASMGCQPWLVMSGNGTKTMQQAALGEALPEGTRTASDLAAVVDALLGEQP